MYSWRPSGRQSSKVPRTPRKTGFKNGTLAGMPTPRLASFGCVVLNSPGRLPTNPSSVWVVCLCARNVPITQKSRPGRTCRRRCSHLGLTSKAREKNGSARPVQGLLPWKFQCQIPLRFLKFRLRVEVSHRVQSAPH